MKNGFELVVSYSTEEDKKGRMGVGVLRSVACGQPTEPSTVVAPVPTSR